MKTTMSEPVVERVMPQNLEAERIVLGSVFYDNNVFLEVATLKPEDFFHEANRLIFRTMAEMSDMHQPIELVLVVDELRRREKLEAVGGAAYIGSLTDSLNRASNVSHYAEIVREKSLLRSAIHMAYRIQEMALGSAAVAETVMDEASQAINDLALTSAAAENEGKTHREAALSLLKSFEENSQLRVMTGVEKLDNMTGGFRATELVTLTAGTGVGKTLFAQQIRRMACDAGLHSMYCSAEMTAEHLLSRELATQAKVAHKFMRVPEKLNRAEFNALMDVALHECDKCRILDVELSLSKIRIAARRRKRATGLDLVIVDYDELVDAPGQTETDQQRNLIRGLKLIGTELRIPVIVISQLRKSLNAEDAARPSLEKIYGSGAKSKHSSFILYLDRPFVRELQGDKTEAKLFVLKARDGQTGQIPLSFNLSTLRFTQGIFAEPEQV
jgi:replicative DNA helicase